MPRLVIELEEAEKLKVEQMAADKGTTVSNLIRKFLKLKPKQAGRPVKERTRVDA